MAELKTQILNEVVSTGAKQTYTFTPNSENDALVINIDATALDGKDLAFLGIESGAWTWWGFSFIVNKSADGNGKVWFVNKSGASSSCSYEQITDLSNIEIIFNPYKGFYFNGKLLSDFSNETVYNEVIEHYKGYFKTGNATPINIGFSQGYTNSTGTIYSAALYTYTNIDYYKMEYKKHYVDYSGLEHYDKKIKAYIDTSKADVILVSENGIKYKLTINDDGILMTTKVVE